MVQTLALNKAWETPNVVVNRMSPDEVVGHWGRIERELNLVPHIWQPYWTTQFLYYSVLGGNMQMWACGTVTQINLVIWTQIGLYPACKSLQVVLALGTQVDEALPILEAELEHFARETECDICEVIGRTGWWSKLKRNGFKRQNETFMKRIENRSLN